MTQQAQRRERTPGPDADADQPGTAPVTAPVTGAVPVARRVTTADIALASGVSRATVSYVLNNVPGRTISAATRKTVLETAQRLGHIPHGPARSLRTGRSQIVLALVRDYAIGYVADKIIEEMDHALAERGFVLMVHRFDEQARPLSELWGLVSPDLVVSMGGLAVPELPGGERSPVKLLAVPGIFPHHRAGAMQVEYLHATGHRAIGYAALENPRVQLIAAERQEGIERARVELGLEPLVQHRFALDDVDGAYAAVDDWLSGPHPVTGVVAHNDETALLLSSVLEAKGLSAGKDLAIIGVDNIPLARINITTVEINIARYTESITEAVMRAIDGAPQLPPVDHQDYLRLIVRNSA